MKNKAKQCFFCQNGIQLIDYKDTVNLRRFITPQGKIASPKRTGLCAKHQRLLSRAVKRARVIALLPFTTR